MEEENALLASLYKTAKTVKNDETINVDPKTLICEYFKQGLCQKGKKCKYSHDMSL
jgi:hypothetical protein